MSFNSEHVSVLRNLCSKHVYIGITTFVTDQDDERIKSTSGFISAWRRARLAGKANRKERNEGMADKP